VLSFHAHVHEHLNGLDVRISSRTVSCSCTLKIASACFTCIAYFDPYSDFVSYLLLLVSFPLVLLNTLRHFFERISQLFHVFAATVGVENKVDGVEKAMHII